MFDDPDFYKELLRIDRLVALDSQLSSSKSVHPSS